MASRTLAWPLLGTGLGKAGVQDLRKTPKWPYVPLSVSLSTPRVVRSGQPDAGLATSRDRAREGWSTGFAENLQMGYSSASVFLSKSMGTTAELGWVGLAWPRLGRPGLGWAGLDWAGLGRAGRGWGQTGRTGYARTKTHTYKDTRTRACMPKPTGQGGDRRCKGERQEFGRPSRN